MGWMIKSALMLTAMIAGGCVHSPTGDGARGAASVFQCLDGNDSGYLETGELRHTSSCEPADTFADRELPSATDGARAQAMIETMDIDGDERISNGEFSAWYGR